eukprot:TRINITY_DN2081_c0_g1_i6.p6 TRINITY_DN2081_c0_g1~~TRINITY_DN2081_c0_g1_i6.p6  ORF type:complete len:117 (-),score=6.59 TRINITY_DN2081_c0_g1_i6:439-789(-)
MKMTILTQNSSLTELKKKVSLDFYSGGWKKKISLAYILNQTKKIAENDKINGGLKNLQKQMKFYESGQKIFRNVNHTRILAHLKQSLVFSGVTIEKKQCSRCHYYFCERDSCTQNG